jgi:hypothetical protein
MLEYHAMKGYMDVEEQPLIFINPIPRWNDFLLVAQALFVRGNVNEIQLRT